MKICPEHSSKFKIFGIKLLFINKLENNFDFIKAKFPFKRLDLMEPR